MGEERFIVPFRGNIVRRVLVGEYQQRHYSERRGVSSFRTPTHKKKQHAIGGSGLCLLNG